MSADPSPAVLPSPRPCLAVLALAALLAGCATRAGIGDADTRVRADVRQAPWRSIGVLRTAVGAQCTGALVGPRTVLTAAHCLFDPATLRPIDPARVQFTLPPASQPLSVRGRGVAFAIGRGFAVAPGFKPSPEAPADADWAMLALDVDMGTAERFLPLAPGFAKPGMPLVYGGYQADQPRVLLADFDCKVLGYEAVAADRPMMRHSCTGTDGASGGPLIGRTGEGVWVVVAIGSLARNGQAGGWAVPAVTVARALTAQPPRP